MKALRFPLILPVALSVSLCSCQNKRELSPIPVPQPLSMWCGEYGASSMEVALLTEGAQLVPEEELPLSTAEKERLAQYIVQSLDWEAEKKRWSVDAPSGWLSDSLPSLYLREEESYLSRVIAPYVNARRQAPNFQICTLFIPINPPFGDDAERGCQGGGAGVQ